MNWLRRRAIVPKVLRQPLRLEHMEDRTVPAVVVNGTAGNDVITSAIFAVPDSTLYLAEIYVNGAVAYSFTNNTWNAPEISVFLPEALTVNGLGGNDRIELGKIRDPEFVYAPTVVHGGPGNDTIVGSNGNDELYGDAGADSLNGGIDEDTLVGDASDKSFVGGGGIDLLKIENFAGTLRATPDYLNLNGNKLTVAAGTFFQIMALDITGSNGPDTIDLDEFPSFLVNASGLGGNDTIRVNAGRGLIDGGPGNDTVVNVSTYEDYLTILGGSGDDTILVNAGLVTIDGGAGNDDIDGRGIVENYLLAGMTALGGPGSDTIRGSDFADHLEGNDGNDTLFGGRGSDVLNGGAGRDSLTGGGDDDTFTADGADANWTGGKGIDTVYLEGSFKTATVTNAAVTVNGKAIAATGLEYLTFVGTAQNDTLDASTFSGFVTISGLEGNDTIRGSLGGSYIEGGEGNDKLFGSAAVDYLSGGRGVDQITAGDGDDQITVDLEDTLVLPGAGFDFVAVEAFGQDLVVTDTQLTSNGIVYVPPDAESIFYLYGGTSGNDSFDASAYSQAVNYSGYEGNDLIRTGSGGDYINPGDGNDTVFAGEGDDSVEDYSGADFIDVGDGTNYVFTYFGNDTVISGSGDDYIDSGDGDDSISSGGGNDTVYSGNGEFGGSNYVDAGPGNDSVTGSAGNDTIYGGDGNDVVLGDNLYEAFAGNDEVHGGDGFDTVVGGGGSDALFGDGGSDNVNFELTDTAAQGGDGYDYLGLIGNVTVAVLTDTAFNLDGTVFADHGAEEFAFSGTEGDDTVDAAGYTGLLGYAGGDGNDSIQSGGGNDLIYAGPGNDTVRGGAGSDRLDGGEGADSLEGEAGTDFLFGGDGDSLLGGDDYDYLQATPLAVLIDGGADYDQVIVQGQPFGPTFSLTDTEWNNGGFLVPVTGIERFSMYTGVSDDTVDATGYSGYFILVDQGGSNSIAVGPGGSDIGVYGNEAFDQNASTTVIGGSGADTISVQLGNNWIEGGGGNDTITGGAGGDWIDGGADHDTIFDFSGDDTLIGGTGNDTIDGGYAGVKAFFGGDGDDVLTVNPNAAVVNAGADNDQVFVRGFFGVNVTVSDTEWINDGTATATGGIETLYLNTDTSDNIIDASAFGGFFVMSDTGGNNFIQTGTGGSIVAIVNDAIADALSSSTVVGGSGSDYIQINAGNNFIYGNGGNDILYAFHGTNVLDGGEGNDELHGGDGDDQLLGGTGNDYLDGGAGTDTLLGGTDADTFVQELDPGIFVDEQLAWDFNAGEGDTLI